MSDKTKDELKKYAYYLNQAINYKYTSVHILRKI